MRKLSQICDRLGLEVTIQRRLAPLTLHEAYAENKQERQAAFEETQLHAGSGPRRIPTMANVYVNRTPVGRLTREDPVNRFAYDEHVPAAQAVSLLMPVNESSYLAERPTVLHPVFDMSLPGARCGMRSSACLPRRCRSSTTSPCLKWWAAP